MLQPVGGSSSGLAGDGEYPCSTRGAGVGGATGVEVFSLLSGSAHEQQQRLAACASLAATGHLSTHRGGRGGGGGEGPEGLEAVSGATSFSPPEHRLDDVCIVGLCWSRYLADLLQHL